MYRATMHSLHRRLLAWSLLLLPAFVGEACAQAMMPQNGNFHADSEIVPRHSYLLADLPMRFTQLPQPSPIFKPSSVAPPSLADAMDDWRNVPISPERQDAGGNDDPGADPHLPLSASQAREPWFSQVLPEGIIYRSYWAGVHEPRMGVQLIRESGGGYFWDPTLGARVGVFRYGDDDPLHPQGWQLDLEGAAMARLTLDSMRDLDSVDFRGGVPLTYGIDNWQFKLGYYHLSSHLGDEYAINHPGSLDKRINYVRDAVMLGVSYYPVDFLRLYFEAAYAFHALGGAEPWEFQFGAELARPGVTGRGGTPFLALHGHLREEQNFGGDFTAEAGWLWRDRTGHVLRIGSFYLNGKSSQYQFYQDSQQQVGAGIWYDF